jgi:hypothetical protein
MPWGVVRSRSLAPDGQAFGATDPPGKSQEGSRAGNAGIAGSRGSLPQAEADLGGGKLPKRPMKVVARPRESQRRIRFAAALEGRPREAGEVPAQGVGGTSVMERTPRFSPSRPSIRSWRTTGWISRNPLSAVAAKAASGSLLSGGSDRIASMSPFFGG